MKEMYESKLKRMSGMSEKQRAYVNNKLAMANDWQINCPTCGKRITGLISDLQTHTECCGDDKSN